MVPPPAIRHNTVRGTGRLPGGASVKFISRNPSALHLPVINSAAILIDSTATPRSAVYPLARPFVCSLARSRLARCLLSILRNARDHRRERAERGRLARVSTDDAVITAPVCVDKPAQGGGGASMRIVKAGPCRNSINPQVVANFRNCLWCRPDIIYKQHGAADIKIYTESALDFC